MYIQYVYLQNVGYSTIKYVYVQVHTILYNLQVKMGFFPGPKFTKVIFHENRGLSADFLDLLFTKENTCSEKFAVAIYHAAFTKIKRFQKWTFYLGYFNVM